MKKQAVIIYGTPGSGKGTQANLLSWNQGFTHFDSGKKLRAILSDPELQNKKLIQREKKLNEAGLLNTPSWVLGIFKKETEKIARAGMSIVYSGSPRTMYEAFGEPPKGEPGKKTGGLLPLLTKLYGKQNVIFFFLKISPEAAASRNKIRRICSVCNNPVLGDTTSLIKCPLCLGELKTRVDDDPEKYKIRYNEYMTRTMPIVDELKKKGVEIIELNGEETPPVIYAKIRARLGF